MGGQYGDGIDSHEKIRREKKMSEKLSILELKEGEVYKYERYRQSPLCSRVKFIRRIGAEVQGKKSQNDTWKRVDYFDMLYDKDFTEIKPEPKLEKHYLVFENSLSGYKISDLALMTEEQFDNMETYVPKHLAIELPPIMLEERNG